MEQLKKNAELELEIDAVSSEGSGIGRWNGMAVFVSGAAEGDRVRALIIKVKKNYAIGKLMQIIRPSKHRVPAGCSVSGRCGGCSYRHISYQEECRIKWNRVRDAFRRIGKLELEPEPLVTAERVNRYRNKAQYPVEIAGGKVQFGFYAGRSHRVVPLDDCVLQPEEFADGLKAVRQWALQTGVTGYDEQSHSGLLRHIYFRKAFGTGEIMACAVSNGSRLPEEPLLVASLRQALPGLRSVLLNRNQEETNVVLGRQYRLLWGQSYITDELLGLKLNLSPSSFYQVNHDQTEKLYTLAKQFAGLTGAETVLDLYCGAGSIGLTMADQAKAVIGVEIVPDAVQNAKENAAQNQITNATFLCMDAAAGAAELKKQGIQADVVILDPPRKGCEGSLIETVAKIAPQRIVYVSCDPGTLARDLAAFAALGYQAQRAVPVDLFPRTVHVETIVLLDRKG